VWKGGFPMTEVHATMTSLESRFEEELNTLPDWHNELEKIEREPMARMPKETLPDKIMAETMILGV